MAQPLVVVCALRGRIFPAVVVEVAAQWPDYELHWDEPDDDSTYADFFRRTWNAGSDLVIVEADSVPPPGSIARLLACPEPWCAHPSWLGNHYEPRTLGLARFSQRLQAELPLAAEQAMMVGRNRDKICPARSVDVTWARYLDSKRVPFHVHLPPARHLRYANEPVDATSSPANT